MYIFHVMSPVVSSSKRLFSNIFLVELFHQYLQCNIDDIFSLIIQGFFFVLLVRYCEHHLLNINTISGDELEESTVAVIRSGF